MSRKARRVRVHLDSKDVHDLPFEEKKAILTHFAGLGM